MGKQIDYPADTVGIDGTVYPTVGENIRHFLPLDNLRWADVAFHVTKGTKPVIPHIKGKFAGICFSKSSKPRFNFVPYIHVYVASNNTETILDAQPALYNYYGGDIVLSLLVYE